MAFTAPESLSRTYRIMLGYQTDRSQINWLDVFDQLEHNMSLGLEKQQQQLLALLHIPLNNVLRLRGNRHVDPAKRDTTAEHQVLGAVDMFERFTRLFGDKTHTDPTLKNMLVTAVLEILLHDVGEAFGELTTASEQANGITLSDKQKEKLETDVAELVIRRAVNIIHNGCTAEDVQAYTKEMKNIFDEIGTERDGINAAGKIQEYVTTIGTQSTYTLPAENTASQQLSQWATQIYHNAEAKKKDRTFITQYMKTAEKMDGMFYNQEYGLRTPHADSSLIPLIYGSSASIIMDIHRVQKGLFLLAKLAKTDDEKILAKDLMNDAYAMTEFALEHGPKMLNRREGKSYLNEGKRIALHSVHNNALERYASTDLLNFQKKNLSAAPFASVVNTRLDVLAVIHAAKKLGVVPPDDSSWIKLKDGALAHNKIKGFKDLPHTLMTVEGSTITADTFIEEIKNQRALLAQRQSHVDSISTLAINGKAAAHTI